MIQTFLTGQSRPDFQSLGVRGLPVTDYSEQIHALLFLRGLQKIADCFAVPLRSPVSQNIQWYSPLQGNVVPWTTAPDEQRYQALLLLREAITAIDQLAENCLAGGHPAGGFFAQLLEKMTHFPGADTLYLINNRPVVTFWSYSPADSNPSCNTIIEGLAADIAPSVQPVAGVTQSETVLFLPADMPQNPQPVTGVPQPVTGKRRHIALTASGVLAVVVFAVAGGYYYGSPAATTAQPVVAERPSAAAPNKVTVSHNQSPVILLPLQPASLKEIPPVTISSPARIVSAASVPPTGLQIPASAVKMGTISFMDGHWKTTLSQSPDQPPLSLYFSFRHGIGKVQTHSAQHGQCKAESRSGFLPSGTLALRSRFTAVCNDGSRLKIPVINCTLSATGTRCVAQRQGENTGQPVTLYPAGGH